MAENYKLDVDGAFEMLVEEIEAQVSLLKKTGALAIEKGLYEKAEETIDGAEKTTRFRDKVVALREEWEDIERGLSPSTPHPMPGPPKKNLSRLPRGLRTGERVFYRPILQALSELGGSARMKSVIDRVGELMKKELKPVDHEPLPSDPETIRWRNTVQWARNSLVKKGLLRGDSPHGTWEITPEGKRHLRDQPGRQG